MCLSWVDQSLGQISWSFNCCDRISQSVDHCDVFVQSVLIRSLVMCVYSDNLCDQIIYSINFNQSITAVISVDRWLYTKCSTKGQPEPVWSYENFCVECCSHMFTLWVLSIASSRAHSGAAVQSVRLIAVITLIDFKELLDALFCRYSNGQWKVLCSVWKEQAFCGVTCSVPLRYYQLCFSRTACAHRNIMHKCMSCVMGKFKIFHKCFCLGTEA